MGKYIDAGKLISEIKGIISAVQTKNHPDALGTMEQCLAAAEIEVLNLVLDDIKELQQDQPEVRLEEEIERIIKNEEMFMKFQVKEQLIKYVARHFAEWGAIHLNARKKK